MGFGEPEVRAFVAEAVTAGLVVGESSFDGKPEVLAVVGMVPVGELADEDVVHELGR
jgi:hypothetical protein